MRVQGHTGGALRGAAALAGVCGHPPPGAALPERPAAAPPPAAPMASRSCRPAGLCSRDFVAVLEEDLRLPALLELLDRCDLAGELASGGED